MDPEESDEDLLIALDIDSDDSLSKSGESEECSQSSDLDNDSKSSEGLEESLRTLFEIKEPSRLEIPASKTQKEPFESILRFSKGAFLRPINDTYFELKLKKKEANGDTNLPVVQKKKKNLKIIPEDQTLISSFYRKKNNNY